MYCYHYTTVCICYVWLLTFANWFIFGLHPVPPLKRSPRTQGSTIRRSRRPGVITQTAAAVISPDPDLLIPIRAPYPCLDEEQGLFLKTLKKQYVSLPATRGQFVFDTLLMPNHCVSATPVLIQSLFII